MINIDELNVIIYLIVAVIVISLGTKFSTPGGTRVFSFASLFSLFFSMGLLVGHGAIPFPGLWILGSCWYTDSCSKMYGEMPSLLLFTIVPMLVQWMIILAISFAVHYVYKRSEFEPLLSNDRDKQSDKHKRIIGSSWIVVGTVIFLMPVVSIAYVFFRGESIPVYQALYHVFSIRSIIAILQVSAGYFLIKNRSWAHQLCLPISVLSLLLVPVGTVLGIYYLWYYFVVKQAKKPDEST